jgi:hypothetical protein
MNINAFLDSSNLCEFVLWSLVDNELLILGSDDLAYYHQVEIAYHGLEYIEAPSSFWRPRFRDATELETRRSWRRRVVGADKSASLYVIEDGGDGAIETYFIAAESCVVSVGMVFHYDRPNLEPGERIAPWVRR